MSDESTTGTPGSEATGEPAGGAAGAQEPSPPGRWARVLPPWVRRRPLLAGVGAGVLAAAVIVAVVLLVLRPSAPQPRYTSLPGQACALVGAADVAKYLPGAKGTPVSAGAGSAIRTGVCKWSSTAGGEDRTLIARADIFRSASAVSQAQQSYRADLADFGCRCQGVMVSAKPVAGLGDQATEAFVVAGPTANLSKAPVASVPGTSLVVRSSNAVIGVYLDTTATATGASQTSPPSSAQVAGMIAMARDVLAALARPAAVAAPPAASLAAEPRYAGRPDSCRLVTPATLARYVPGASLTPLPAPARASPPASSVSDCSWLSRDAEAELDVSTYRVATAAGQRFQEDTAISSQSDSQLTLTGMRWLNDLGESALASFHDQNTTALVDVIVWSGNAELHVTYSDFAPGATSPPEAARLLAAATAMARDGLAALAAPTFPQGPRYASPDNACQLVKASTLSKYAPGVAAGQLSGLSPGAPGEVGTSTCFWGASTGFLNLEVDTYSSVDYAQGAFQFGVTFTNHLDTVKGTQPVRGLGEQATAVFEIDVGSPQVELFVQSGNALVDMSYKDDTVDSAPLSRAGKLAADIAVARDVLALLHRA